MNFQPYSPLSKKQIEEKLSEFPPFCREAGLKVTPQRLAIYRCVLELRNHPKAEDIYLKIKEEHPSISRSTVYNTLESLCHKKLLRKISVHKENALRYDIESSHSHLICTNCEGIFDVVFPLGTQKEALFNGISQTFSFEVRQIQIYGLCQDCSSSPSCLEGKRMGRPC